MHTFICFLEFTQPLVSCLNIVVNVYQCFRCFIMDDKGYLVAHPKLIEPNSKVIQHITHKVSNSVLVKQSPFSVNAVLNVNMF